MRYTIAPNAFLITLNVLLALMGRVDLVCGGASKVEVRITDHRPGKDDFSALLVSLAEVSLHPAARRRGMGWVAVVRDTPAVDILPLKDGHSAGVGAADVEAARYDAVKVQFGEVQGVLRSDQPAPVSPRDSTVAVDLLVEPGTERVILIDLFVEDQSDHRPGHYMLMIRAVRIEPP